MKRGFKIGTISTIAAVALFSGIANANECQGLVPEESTDIRLAMNKPGTNDGLLAKYVTNICNKARESLLKAVSNKDLTIKTSDIKRVGYLNGKSGGVDQIFVKKDGCEVNLSTLSDDEENRKNITFNSIAGSVCIQ